MNSLTPYRNNLSQNYRLFGLVLLSAAIAFFMFYAPEASANFVKQMPKEAENFQSQGFLGGIMTIIIAVFAIIAGVGIVGIPMAIIYTVITQIGKIRKGQGEWGEVTGTLLIGGVVFIICIALVYFGWDYLEAAQKMIS